MGREKIDITNGPIAKVLLKLTWPMLFGMLGIMVFNLTDTFFIGKLGVQQLAAISFTFPVVMFINSLALGMGIGTASLISRTYVSEPRKVVQKYAVDAIFLAVFVVVSFVLIGLLSIDPIFRLLGVTDELMPFVKDYMQIWFWGVPFVVVPMVGNNIIRATGDTFTPGMIMVFSAVVNVILDPILIFGWGSVPSMGLKGAALATVFSRAMGLVVAIYILAFREKLLVLYIPVLKELWASWKKILYVAAPAATGMLITPISMGIITRFVSSYGKEAVAAFGIVSRIEMFILMIVMA
ncbi:MAG: MATE family efflux transporter, partial [Prolixibacteraceae bacterium]|nr:MATE family efflux transporter [Prolixibacteraceae bacterium]